MRFSGLHALVCLAAVAIASPTPFNGDSLEARGTWTSPARRSVFDKREALARREADEILARELEELAQREEEGAEKRNFEELQERYFEEIAKREWKQSASRDLESRELLSFNGLPTKRSLSTFDKRDPQFNIGSFITNLRNQIAAATGRNTTAGGNTGTGTGTGTGTNNGNTNTNTGLGRLNNLGSTVSNRISAALGRLGFNFRRGELEELMERSPVPFSLGSAEDDAVARRAPFKLEAFVKSRRSEIVD
ncbi:hypothetical protein PENSPDRAFT_683253 [Peniophora sp. CONT]|nr:hypothetical protein PENSPDRAFT_683253 [Peniophora sp. CONT]